MVTQALKSPRTKFKVPTRCFLVVIAPREEPASKMKCDFFLFGKGIFQVTMQKIKGLEMEWKAGYSVEGDQQS